MLLQGAPVEQSLDIIGLLIKGGVVMLILLLLSVAAIIIIAERLMFISKNAKIDDKSLETLASLMEKNDKAGMRALCEKRGDSWGRIFNYAAITDVATPAELDKILEDAANIEVSRLEKGLSYLSMIAGLAPLFGFVGTIIGVITIFFDISISSDISISIISEGLYKKMVLSAAGLVVGILAFSAYHLFQNQIDKFVSNVQEHALVLKVAMSKKNK
jgi:biopolymer transport protein ExbB